MTDPAAVTVEGTPVNFEQIKDCAKETKEWLAQKLTTGRCSKLLVAQLAMHVLQIPQPMSGRLVLADFHEVIDQIGQLEGAPMCRPAPTKAAEPFKGVKLRGLYHKHWFQASFIPHLLLQLNERMGQQLIMRALTEQYGRGNVYGRNITADDARLMADATVNCALEGAARRGELTGEWIVFAKVNGRNYYLALAGHDDGDETILKYCRPAVEQFPELSAVPCLFSPT